MSIDPLELEIPEFDEDRSPVKRGIAITAALLTFFGAWVVLLQASAGVEADKATRDAQISAATAVRAGVQGDQAVLEASAIWVDSEDYERRAAVADAAAFADGGDDESAEGERWEAVRNSLAPLSPLVADPTYGTDADPGFPGRYITDQSSASNLAFVRQQVERDRANAWGQRSGRLGAVITMIAVVLFLLGLSLTVAPGVRAVLLVPAAIIASGSVAVVLMAMAIDVVQVPDRAVELVAEGDRLQGQARFDEAIARYDDAVDLAPDFDQAYVHRASARFVEGANAPPGQQFLGWAPAEAVDRAAEDMNKALALGLDDVYSWNLAGALRIQQGRFAEGETAAEQATDLNPANPLPWINRAAAQLGQGNLDQARETFGIATDRIADRPDSLERQGLYAVAITVLQVVAEQEPARADAVAAQIAALVQTRMEREYPGPAVPASEVSDLRITFRANAARLDYTAASLPAGSHVATIWYTRGSSDKPWTMESSMSVFERTSAALEGGITITGYPGWCAGGGEYRVDLYVEGELAGSTTARRDPPEVPYMTYAFDSVMGVSLCRPLDWRSEVVSGDHLRVESPGGDDWVQVDTYPLAGGLQTAEQAIRILDSAVGEGTPKGEFVEVTRDGVTGIGVVWVTDDDLEVTVEIYPSSPNEVSVVVAAGEVGKALAATVAVS